MTITDSNRAVWFLGGVFVLLVLCLIVLIGAGFYFYRTNEQQQQIMALQATVTAQANALAPAVAATGSSSASTTPSPTLPAVTPAAPNAFEASPTAAATRISTRAATRSAPALEPLAPPTLNALTDLERGLTTQSRAVLAQNSFLPRYRIGGRLDPDSRMIAGNETLQFTNTTGVSLNLIVLRLFANAPQYGEGEMDVAAVRANGQTLQTKLQQDDTVLEITLPQSLTTNQSIEVSLRFTTTVPTSGAGYGIFNVEGGVFALYNWYPQLDLNDAGKWLEEPIAAQGDPNNADTANYLVTFAAPDDYLMVASGSEINHTASDGSTTHEFAGPLTRNFVIVASNQFQRATQKIGETIVSSYYLAADADGGKAVLQDAAHALDVYSKQFGTYPFSEFDVSEVHLAGGAAGMEASGLIMIGADYYDPQMSDLLSSLGPLLGGSEKLDVVAFIVAHETAHQWWYGIVGNDAEREPWLDESLTNWSAAYYIDQTAGAEAGTSARDLLIRLPYLVVLTGHDKKLDQPVDQFTPDEYEGIVYGKGALMYDVLRRQMGDARYFEFLRRYLQTHQYARVNGDEWEKTLAQVTGQSSAQAFYDKWVESDTIRESDLPPGGPLSQAFSDPQMLELLKSLIKSANK